MLELHVWGPAFGLPSIDPECLAAIAYLNTSLASSPQRDEWVLIANHDPSSSPSKDFPALRDGNQWMGGFDAIVRHLRDHHNVNLDRGLNSTQRADLTAFVTLHRTAALPLFDVAFYTSFSNYYHSTRPAFTTILPWHANYIVPPSRRAAARERSSRLGVGALEADTIHESSGVGSSGINSRYEAAKRAAGIGAAGDGGNVQVGPGKQRLSTLLKSPEHAARFKLDGLCAAYLEPIDAFLAGNETLFDTPEPTSLDCLALGYMSLMLYPKLHQSWLSETFMAKYPRVEAYTNRHRRRFFGRDVSPEAVLSINALAPEDRTLSSIRAARRTLSLDLPWSPCESRSATATAASIGRELLDSLPGASHLRGWGSPSVASGKPVPEVTQTDRPTVLPYAITTLAGLIVLAAGAAYWQSGFGESRTAEPQHVSEAGAMLAALSQQMRFDTQEETQLRPQVSGQVGGGTDAVEVQGDVRLKRGAVKSTKT